MTKTQAPTSFPTGADLRAMIRGTATPAVSVERPQDIIDRTCNCGTVCADPGEAFFHCDVPAPKFVTRPSNFGSGTTTVRNPSFPTNAATVRPATEKQISFLKSLAAELHPGTEDHIAKVIAGGFDRVRKAIDTLVKERDAKHAASPSEAPVAAPKVTRKLVNKFAAKCGNCGHTVPEGAGVLERNADDTKWVVWHIEGECHVSQTFPFPDGRYAVDNAEGELRFYLCTDGSVFVMASDTEYPVVGKAAEAVVAKIAEDPKGASARYGQEIGHCGLCGRTLTNDDSRKHGIGPVCANKAGW